MNTTRLAMLRTRWAAIGAAVAITLGGGGIGITHAIVDSDPKAVYDPLASPCRAADLRGAPFTVGPRSAPLGPNETYILDGWGTEGNCTLPTGTAAIEVNVTAVDPTEPTFLRFWPGDGAEPETANLNPTPGQPPTPNSVTIGLSAADGTFKVFNRFGSVSIIIDVVGVYDDHAHDGADIIDGSLTGADIADGSVGSADIADGSVTGADIANGTITGADIADESVTGADIDNNTVSNLDTSNEPGVSYAFNTNSVSITSTPAAVVSTFIRVPSDGHVAIEATGHWNPGNTSGTDGAQCQLQKGTPTAINTSEPWFWLWDRNNTQTGFDVFSAHRLLPIAAADNPPIFNTGQRISLVCDEQAGNVVIADVQISATFYATSYSPVVLTIPFP